MRSVVLWGLLVLLCLQTPVGSHVLGRASATGDLAQLKVRELHMWAVWRLVASLTLTFVFSV